MSQGTALRLPLVSSRLAAGFVAGFLATLVFHEFGVEICHLAGLTANTPFNLHPVPPFAVPRVISLAFWGGVWGVPYVLAERTFPRKLPGYWAAAIVFGALVPTVFSWLVIAPLKGLPLGYGFRFPGLLTGPIVNGLWGLGTGMFLLILPRAGTRAYRG